MSPTELVDRAVKTALDVTVGTAIVLWHVALVRKSKESRAAYRAMSDGSRAWDTQISP